MTSLLKLRMLRTGRPRIIDQIIVDESLHSCEHARTAIDSQVSCPHLEFFHDTEESTFFSANISGLVPLTARVAISAKTSDGS